MKYDEIIEKAEYKAKKLGFTNIDEAYKNIISKNEEDKKKMNELRKILKIKTSQYICIPKQWVKKHKIESGDYLSIKEVEQGSLNLSRLKKRRRYPKMKNMAP